MKLYKKIPLVTIMILFCSHIVSGAFAPGQSEADLSQEAGPHAETKSRTEIWQVILNMNFCRLEGHPKDLIDCLHPNIVAIMPTTRERLEGKEDCIAAWTEFSRAISIEYHTKSDKKIDIHNNTAVVTYYLDMFYIKDNHPIHQSHRDMVVLIKENDKWVVVAHHSSPFPKNDEMEKIINQEALQK